MTGDKESKPMNKLPLSNSIVYFTCRCEQKVKKQLLFRKWQSEYDSHRLMNPPILFSQ